MSNQTQLIEQLVDALENVRDARIAECCCGETPCCGTCVSTIVEQALAAAEQSRDPIGKVLNHDRMFHALPGHEMATWLLARQEDSQAGCYRSWIVMREVALDWVTHRAVWNDDRNRMEYHDGHYFHNEPEARADWVKRSYI